MPKILTLIIAVAVLITIAIAVYLITTKNTPMEKTQVGSEYSTEQLQDAIKRKVVIIDIRRLDEWQKTGIIKNSYKMTFFDALGQVNIDKWMADFKQIVKNKDQEFILVCAHANRTKAVLKFLQEKLGYTHAHDLQGGINYGWIDKGLKTLPY